jgi:hypothetical protein
MQKHRILDVLDVHADAAAKHGYYRERKLGVLPKVGEKVVAVDLQEIRLGHRPRTCRARAAIHERDLAEDLTGLQDIEEDFLVLRRNRVNAYPPGKHALQRLPCVALGEDLFVGAKVPDRRKAHQAVENRGIGIAKEDMLRQQRSETLHRIVGHVATSSPRCGKAWFP